MATANVTKGDLTELKSLKSPPQAVKDVLSATACLLGHTIHDAKNWKVIQKMLADAKFLDTLLTYDVKNCTPEAIKDAKQLMGPYSAEICRKKSAASSSMYNWNQNIIDRAGGGD